MLGDKKLKFCCPRIGQSAQFVAALELLLKIEALSCDPAGIIPWQARSANIRPHGVDRARRRDADISHKGCAAIAAASHTSLLVIDIRARYPIDIGFIL
jgi:hypothetical protein